MCGRYAFFSAHEAVRRLFGAVDVPLLEPRYNIAPTQSVPVLREEEGSVRNVVLLHWGLIPSWARERSIGQRMINARAETLADKPAFRAAFRRRRCLVLADGWYEWLPGPRGKQPYFIRQASGEPFGMAGLWESWDDRDSGEQIESCTIVTADAVPAIRHIHDRMPAVLSAEEGDRWLDPGNHDVAALGQLLAAREAQAFLARPVSRRVNDARNEGPDLVEPVDPAA